MIYIQNKWDSALYMLELMFPAIKALYHMLNLLADLQMSLLSAPSSLTCTLPSKMLSNFPVSVPKSMKCTWSTTVIHLKLDSKILSVLKIKHCAGLVHVLLLTENVFIVMCAVYVITLCFGVFFFKHFGQTVISGKILVAVLSLHEAKEVI